MDRDIFLRSDYDNSDFNTAMPSRCVCCGCLLTADDFVYLCDWCWREEWKKKQNIGVSGTGPLSS